MSATRLSSLAKENVGRVLAALVVFVIAGAATLLIDVPLHFRLVAALLAVVGLAAFSVWVDDPWSTWVAHHGRRLIVVGAPLGAAVAVLVAGSASRPPPVDPQLPATLVLVDASSAMQEEFDDGVTKFEAAQQRVKQHTIDFASQQLGLAAYGVDDCDDPARLRQIVTIAQDQAAAVDAGIADLSPGGQANLVRGGRAAVQMLATFKATGSRIVLVAGSLEDQCGHDLRDLFRESQAENVDVTWDLLGLGLSADDKSAAAQLTDVNVVLADTSEELDDAAQLLLFERVVRDGLERLEAFLSNAREPLNSAADAAQDGRLAEAQEHLAAAEQEVETGRTRFVAISDEERTVVLDGVEARFEEQLLLMQEAVPLLREAIEHIEAHDDDLSDEQRERRNQLIANYNEVIDAYNAGVRAITDEVARVLSDTFDR